MIFNPEKSNKAEPKKPGDTNRQTDFFDKLDESPQKKDGENSATNNPPDDDILINPDGERTESLEEFFKRAGSELYEDGEEPSAYEDLQGTGHKS